MNPPPTSSIDRGAQLRLWHNDQAVIGRFRELLSDPVLQQALRLTQLIGIPMLQRTDADPKRLRTALMLDQARQAGWHAALATFDNLKNIPVAALAAPQEAWAHIGEEDTNQE